MQVIKTPKLTVYLTVDGLRAVHNNGVVFNVTLKKLEAWLLRQLRQGL
jgi:hypothetical protein